ncbi:MnhB domain-containing protein [Pannonibacter sp. Q-1]|uniref:Cation:proton antiporter n=1 Tax=Pannonibacter phragmitetus TaxID=121719 RepID=A0A0U3PKE1_9HYPH|nr:MnhB domain-containing protein [Pannonibacter phragmitetus]ALV27709.1 cation:proton antiporter [Pannonibacter phragmitetus]MBA4204767.1 Na+/H+ antiporter subunit A [Polymorphum sp.]
MSIIFSTMSRLVFVLLLVVSVYMLFRGHNEPGGGFIGGLFAALGFALLALAGSVETARRALMVHPIVLMGCGLFLSFISGLPGLFSDGSFLTHWWAELGSAHVGTATIFDIGVFMVVIGGVLSLVFRFYEGVEQ